MLIMDQQNGWPLATHRSEVIRAIQGLVIEPTVLVGTAVTFQDSAVGGLCITTTALCHIPALESPAATIAIRHRRFMQQPGKGEVAAARLRSTSEADNTSAQPAGLNAHIT